MRYILFLFIGTGDINAPGKKAPAVSADPKPAARDPDTVPPDLTEEQKEQWLSLRGHTVNGTVEDTPLALTVDTGTESSAVKSASRAVKRDSKDLGIEDSENKRQKFSEKEACKDTAAEAENYEHKAGECVVELLSCSL